MVSYYEVNIKIEESEACKSLSILQIKEMGKVAVKFGSKNVGNESLHPILVKLLKGNRVATKVNSIMQTLLYTRFKGNRATDWGLLQEDVNKSTYLEIIQ